MTFEVAKEYGFWAMVFFFVLDRAIIPLANKLIPARIKVKNILDERTVVAQENVAKALVQIMEVQRQYTHDHETIIAALVAQSASLAVLLDRVERGNKISQKRINRKKTS